MINNYPQKIGCIHFIGIGGIGMSGIAEILLQLGYPVQGSDINESKITKRLEKIGGKIFIGHNKNHVSNVDLVVYSSAIDNKNPEILTAKKLSIPLIHRSEMLGELMRLKKSIAIAGTHGKTTVSIMLSHLLKSASYSPSAFFGGISLNYDTNFLIGNSEYMIIEADEYDQSFLKLNQGIGSLFYP